jgi:DNA ligase-1
VVAAVRALPARSLVLDGEAMGFADDGRALPFQEINSRAARRREPTALRPHFFDLLHLDGADLLDAPAHERWAALDAAVPAHLRVTRTTVHTEDEAAAAFAAAVDARQEGLVVKATDAPYDVGRRGAAWVKVKPRHTLDLVILAAEWGHGRRRGWLSNLHLGARDEQTGGFVMLGKTFKGLTDEMLRWQTERLRELAVERGDWVVTVRPELVVEIAFDGVQTSPRYPGGVALRFARVLRYREDKSAAPLARVMRLSAALQPALRSVAASPRLRVGCGRRRMTGRQRGAVLGLLGLGMCLAAGQVAVAEQGQRGERPPLHHIAGVLPRVLGLRRHRCQPPVGRRGLLVEHYVAAVGRIRQPEPGR